MQLAAIAQTTRPEAAKALIAVPMGIAMTATMTAMTKSMAGQSASRADLVAPLLEQLSVEAAKQTMYDAIDGAVAIVPEVRFDVAALKQAADGVAALLTEFAADTTQGDAQAALAAIMTPLEPMMAPIMEAALVLDPTLKVQQ
jgi:hypothetical protein